MSALYTHLVWNISGAKGSHKLVLLALADHSDRNGTAQLSLRDISGLCGLSPSRVKDIIKSLVESRELVVIDNGRPRPGAPASYSLEVIWAATGDPESPRELYTLTDSAKGEDTGSWPMDGPGICTGEDMDRLGGNDQRTEQALIRPSAPEPAPFSATDPQPENRGVDITPDDVAAILAAAGVGRDETRPFYWSRHEHRIELAAEVDRLGMTVPDLCAACKVAVSSGRSIKGPVGRIRAVVAALGIKRGAA